MYHSQLIVVEFPGGTAPALRELLITTASFTMKGQLWPLYNVQSKGGCLLEVTLLFSCLF